MNARILIVDDDKDMLDVLAFKLTQAGYEVVGVSDGQAALESIESNPPRLVILDYMMSGLSGLDVLRRVRANDATKNLAVILLTGRTGDSDVDAAFAIGANDYITKPVSPRELLHRVNALLARDNK